MNDATTYADIVLPACSWYEQEAELVGSWSNYYIQYRHQCIEPLWEAKQDHTIYAEISERMGYGEYWGSVDDSINEIIDNFVEDKLRNIDKKELFEKVLPRHFTQMILSPLLIRSILRRPASWKSTKRVWSSMVRRYQFLKNL